MSLARLVPQLFSDFDSISRVDLFHFWVELNCEKWTFYV